MKFDNRGDEATVFTGGQACLDTVLLPGEKIRTPLMAFLEYGGRDGGRAQNLWRHWFTDCNMRRPGGKPFPAAVSGGTNQLYEEMTHATEENQIAALRAYRENGVRLDYWWMDAGWYFRTGQESPDTWLPTGTWLVDTVRFPG